MIAILKKEDCCGCNACGDVCNHNAITFEIDNEGFWYPKVDHNKCVDCNLCEKVCPNLSRADNIKRYPEPKVYAAYTKNDFIRTDSTSGGLFSMFAEAMYAKKAFVGGAIFNPDHTVSQIISDSPLLLDEIRSSKYLQSNSQGIYTSIKRELRNGRLVLYCGCPCQIQALYKFLGKEYENLVTCDFLCRGVNSPKVFIKYIEMLEKKYNSHAKKIKFKAKNLGWHNFGLRVEFDNGRQYFKDRWHDLFFIGYLQAGNFARPSCYKCNFKGFPQKADITLADFWGIENIDKSMDQNRGTSLVMINSSKGQELFEEIKNSIIWKEFGVKEAREGNPAMDLCLEPLCRNRDQFFEDLDKYDFGKVAKIHFPPLPKPRIMMNIKRPIKLLRHIYKVCGFSIYKLYNYGFINFFSKNVQRNSHSSFSPCHPTVFQFEQDSCLIIKGNLVAAEQQVKKARMQSRLLLERNAKMIVNGTFFYNGNSYIRVVTNATLLLNDGFINENVQIIAGSTVTIGKGVAIGRDVIIRSYDGHYIDEDNYQVSEPITIGNNVWIGQGAKILKGVTIGDGAIIGTGAIVTRDIPPRSLAVGVPARVVRENVSWRL